MERVFLLLILICWKDACGISLLPLKPLLGLIISLIIPAILGAIHQGSEDPGRVCPCSPPPIMYTGPGCQNFPIPLIRM